MSHPISVRRSRSAGFTLVELLVALVVLGFILAAVAGGVRFGNRAWETSKASSAAIEDVATAQLFLRRRIGEVVPLSADLGGRVSQIALHGEPNHLRFVAPWLSPVGAGGLYLFEIGPTADGNLGLSWTLLHPELAEASVPRRDGERILLRQIEGVRMRYFGDPDFADTSGWQSRWADPVFLPRLVAIDVAFATSDRRSWPTLIVAPRAMAISQ